MPGKQSLIFWSVFSSALRKFRFAFSFIFHWVLCSQDKWSSLGTEVCRDRRSALVYENRYKKIYMQKRGWRIFFQKWSLVYWMDPPKVCFQRPTVKVHLPILHIIHYLSKKTGQRKWKNWESIDNNRAIKNEGTFIWNYRADQPENMIAMPKGNEVVLRTWFFFF